MWKLARLLLAALVGSVLGLLLCCGGGTLFLVLFTVNDNSGSPALATKWKAVLEELPNLEEARKKVPGIQGKQYSNGEWVFGLCQSSHALRNQGGGTLVVKDSRGRIRAFFGHVCGPTGLEMLLFRGSSPDEFYKQLLEDHNFKEYQWP